MNGLVTAKKIASPSEDIASPPVMDTTGSARDSGTRTPSLSSEQEAFLLDRFSIKLEDPRTGRWIRSWRAEG